MSMDQILDEKFKSHYKPHFMELVNESHMHSSGLGGSSHYKALIVSDVFVGLSKVQRQRHVFSVLSVEMKSIHALSLRLLTPEEWSKDQSQFQSPPCHHK